MNDKVSINLPSVVDIGNGVGMIHFLNLPAFVSAASDLSNNEKPIFLSLMMSRTQVQQIIDNKHLFDLSMVNAAYLLLSEYDGVVINNAD